MKVHIEYQGGPRGGEILSGSPEIGDLSLFEIDDPTFIYWTTDYGRRGATFSLFIEHSHNERQSPHPLPPFVEHRYRIGGKIDDGHEVFLLVTYIGVQPEDVPREDGMFWYEDLINKGVPELVAAHPNFPYID